MMVYLYKEYDESMSYGEELIQVFDSKERALENWKANVGQYFDQPFDPTSKDLILDYYADLEYDEEAGYALYNWEDSWWIVEPKVVC